MTVLRGARPISGVWSSTDGGPPEAGDPGIVDAVPDEVHHRARADRRLIARLVADDGSRTAGPGLRRSCATGRVLVRSPLLLD
jgi:hypothetical protein